MSLKSILIEEPASDSGKPLFKNKMELAEYMEKFWAVPRSKYPVQTIYAFVQKVLSEKRMPSTNFLKALRQAVEKKINESGQSNHERFYSEIDAISIHSQTHKLENLLSDVGYERTYQVNNGAEGLTRAIRECDVQGLDYKIIPGPVGDSHGHYIFTRKKQ